MNENRLVEIEIADLPKLRDMYRDRKTETNSFNTIQICIDWLKKEPSLDFVQLYSLNGEWSDGTFVIIVQKSDLMFNTLSDSGDRLLSAFNCLDSNGEYLFYGFSSRLLPTVKKYFKQFDNISTTPAMSALYHIPNQQALKFNTEPPSLISLVPLHHEHVDTINSIWPHRTPRSEVFVSHLISKNLTLGACDKEGNLLAWIFQFPIGSLGILQVKDEYKRKGYGCLMVHAMSKMLAEKDLEIIAPVVYTNTASRKMFEKLNFKEIDRVYWWQKPTAV